MNANRISLMAGVGMALAAVGAAGAHPTLFPARQFPTSGLVRSFHVADINQDGVPDVVNLVLDGVEVSYGKGDGTLSDPVLLAPGATGGSIAIADFNANGAPDIAVRLIVDDAPVYQILVNDGFGGFEEWALLEAGSEDAQLLGVDLTGSGAADLVAASTSDAALIVHRNLGGGQFADPQTVPLDLTRPPVNLAAGDFNGSGAPDIALADTDAGRVILYGNDGAGNLALESILQLDGLTGNVVVGDFDGDGRDDLAVGTLDDVGAVHVFLQRDSAFQQSVYPVGSLRDSSLPIIAAADVDGDGRLDLVASNWVPREATFAVLRNRGDGRFASAVLHEFGVVPFRLALADVDGDGAPDVITATNFSGPWINVFRNRGDGAFVAPIAPRTAHLPQARLWRVAAGDLSGNGIDDLVVANLSGPLQVLHALGGGAFSDPLVLPVGLALRDVAVGDVTGDGHLDLIAVGASGSQALLRDSDGFQPGTVQSIGGVWVFAADFNNDGRMDFLSNFVVALSNGDGTFTQSQSLGPCNTRNPAIGDVNGNGFPDIVAVCGGTLHVWINNGDGTFPPPRTYPGGQPEGRVALGDLNGNGRLDAVIAGDDGVTLLAGGGDGKFSVVGHLDNERTHAIRLRIADIDGDGRPDIVELNDGAFSSWPSGLRIRLNEGGWRFSEPQRFAAGPLALALALGDLTGDGRIDVAVANDVLGESRRYQRLLVYPNQVVQPAEMIRPLRAAPRGR